MIEVLKERKLMKQLAAINRETVPKRVMFARGTGARGVFQPYMSLSDYTQAAFLSDPEKITPVLVRFSKALDRDGETGPDLRGFAAKFYTEEGNYDLLCGSMPVFYISDPIKLPKLMEALRREKKNNLNRPERFWSFVSANPESISMILRLHGEGGTIKSYRHMPGYSINTYRWLNKKGQASLVRYSWMPLSGARAITRQEGEFLAGFDEDAASRELCETLSEGKAAEYELLIQLVEEESCEQLPFALADATRIWPADRVPYIRIGKLSLTEPVNDYFNEVERVAFSPANLVRGIGFSSDPMLPIMAFAMEDSQRHRLGSGYEELPVNRCRACGNREEAEDEEFTGVRLAVRKNRLKNKVPYEQAGEYYQSLCEEEKRSLEDNLTDALMFLADELQRELIRHFLQVDQELGKRIAKGLGF